MYIVHEANQLPDVSNIRMIDVKSGMSGYNLLGKRVISQPIPQLERLPCSDFDFLTCTDRLYHATLAEEPYNCKVSIFDNGKHLFGIDNKELSECSSNITYEVIVNCSIVGYLLLQYIIQEQKVNVIDILDD